MINYTPIADRLIIKPLTDEENIGGIIIPQTSEGLKRGKAVAVGKGKDSPMTIKVGDIVLYKRDNAMPVNLDGEDYIICHEHQLVVVKNEP